MAGTSLPNITANQRTSTTPQPATKPKYLQHRTPHSASVHRTAPPPHTDTGSRISHVNHKLYVKQCMDDIHKLQNEHDAKVDLLSQLQRKVDTAESDLKSADTTIADLQATQPHSEQLKQYVQQQFRLQTTYKSYVTQCTATQRALTDLDSKLSKADQQLKQLKHDYALMQQADNQHTAKLDSTLNKVVKQRTAAQQRQQRTQLLDAQIEESLMEMKQHEPVPASILSYNERMRHKQAAMKQQQTEEKEQLAREYDDRIAAVDSLKQSLHQSTLSIKRELAGKQLRRTVRSANRATERQLLTEQGKNAAAIFAARDEASKLQPVLRAIEQSKRVNEIQIHKRVHADAAYVQKQHEAEQRQVDAVKQYRVDTCNNIVDKQVKQLSRKKWQLMTEPAVPAMHSPDNDDITTNTATAMPAVSTDLSAAVDSNADALTTVAAEPTVDTHTHGANTKEVSNSITSPVTSPTNRSRPVAKPSAAHVALPSAAAQLESAPSHARADSTFGEAIGLFSNSLRSPTATQHRPPPAFHSPRNTTQTSSAAAHTFLASPLSVQFDQYEVGGRYACTVTLTNVSGMLNALRLNKLADTLYGSLTIMYESVGQMSPGIANTVVVMFQPSKQLFDTVEQQCSTELTFIDIHHTLHCIPITCTKQSQPVLSNKADNTATAHSDKVVVDTVVHPTATEALSNADELLSDTVRVPVEILTQTRMLSAKRRPIPRPVQAKVQPIDPARNQYDDMKL